MSPAFPVRCAWCSAEGRETVIGVAAVEHSHGICAAHAAAVLADARARRAAR